MTKRLMVVVDVVTQQRRLAPALVDDLVSGLTMTIDDMDDAETKDAVKALIGDVVAHGTAEAFAALLYRLLGGEAATGAAVLAVDGLTDDPRDDEEEQQRRRLVVGTAMCLAGTGEWM